MIEWLVKITDHSYWNKITSWQALWDRGVRVVVLRLTVGATYVDPNFDPYYRMAKQIGFKVLAYHLMNPFYSALVNFMNFLNASKNYVLDGPPVLDVEITGGQTYTTVAIRVQEACKLFETLTGELIIYTRKYFWDPIMGLAQWAKKYFLWVASYWTAYTGDLWPAKTAYTTTIPNTWLTEPKADPFMWQFNDHGRMPEVSPGDMDKSAAYPAFVAMLKRYEQVNIPSEGKCTNLYALDVSTGYGEFKTGYVGRFPAGVTVYYSAKATSADGVLWFRVAMPDLWIPVRSAAGEWNVTL